MPGTGNAIAWPDFIGLGTVKSGTTWLYRCIKDHPDSFMPSMKEIQYFDEHYDLGLDWYLSFFAKANGRVTGEISPRYITNGDVLQRLRKIPANVKFLVSFRDPVQRAYSHFQMDMRESVGLSELDKVNLFDEVAGDPSSEYIRFGAYSDQLRPFIKQFGIERFHFVVFDEIKSNPQTVLAGLYAYLGLDEKFVPESISQKANESKRYKNVRLFRFMRKLVRVGESIGFARVLMWLKVVGVRDRVLNLVERTEGYLPMNPETKDELISYYAPSVLRLEEMIGKDLSSWRKLAK